jgi:hypothetical protein
MLILKTEWKRSERVLLCWAVAALSWMSLTSRASVQGQAEHMILMIWDGMLPDSITQQYCPTLARTARSSGATTVYSSAPLAPAEMCLRAATAKVKPTKPMDGRVLQEALVQSTGPVSKVNVKKFQSTGLVPKVNVKKVEATPETGLFRWTQYLQFSEVNGTFYFDEGNGEPVSK